MTRGAFYEVLDSLPSKYDSYEVRLTPKDRDRAFGLFCFRMDEGVADGEDYSFISIACPQDDRCEEYDEARPMTLADFRDQLDYMGQMSSEIRIDETTYDEDFENDDGSIGSECITAWDPLNVRPYVNEKRKRIDLFIKWAGDED